MKLIPNVASRAVMRQALLAQKNAPTLLFGTGVVGMVGSTVLACRATLKLSETFHEVQHDLDIARSIDDPKYTDRQKDMAIIYTRGVLKMGRLYGPSILIGAASIGCLTKSHNLLNQRNLALTAAYTAVDEAFQKYRSRVIEKYGEEEDRDLRYTSEEVTFLGENGKATTIKRAGPDPDGSMYARYFDEYSSRKWSVEPEYNFAFLSCQQNYANDMLKARGHVFLNEVYDWLGFERTKAGQVVGWVLNGDGDNFIDFGLFDEQFKDVNDFFANGREGSILLDFNVDGIIYDKIDKRGDVAWQQ